MGGSEYQFGYFICDKKENYMKKLWLCRLFIGDDEYDATFAYENTGKDEIIILGESPKMIFPWDEAIAYGEEWLP